MVESHDIFPNLDYVCDRAEMVRRLSERQFPDTNRLSVLGSVIMKCWELKFCSLRDVVESIITESPAPQVFIDE